MLSAISAELQLNFLEAKNRDLKNFNVKGSRTGLVSPVNVTFSETGVIPPPRMFSDNNTITLSIRSEPLTSETKMRTSIMELDSEQHFKNEKQTLPPDHPMVTIIDDDVPAKEPRMSAVPSKSALKKPKTCSSSSVTVSNSGNFSSSNQALNCNTQVSCSPRFSYGFPAKSSSNNSSSLPCLPRTRPLVVLICLRRRIMPDRGRCVPT